MVEAQGADVVAHPHLAIHDHAADDQRWTSVARDAGERWPPRFDSDALDLTIPVRFATADSSLDAHHHLHIIR